MANVARAAQTMGATMLGQTATKMESGVRAGTKRTSGMINGMTSGKVAGRMNGGQSGVDLKTETMAKTAGKVASGSNMMTGGKSGGRKRNPLRRTSESERQTAVKSLTATELPLAEDHRCGDGLALQVQRGVTPPHLPLPAAISSMAIGKAAGRAKAMPKKVLQPSQASHCLRMMGMKIFGLGEETPEEMARQGAVEKAALRATKRRPGASCVRCGSSRERMSGARTNLLVISRKMTTTRVVQRPP